jgi:hypothetical protein
MDPIHPIHLETEHPAPIDPIRPVSRRSDEPPSEQRPPRESRRRAPRPAPPAISADGHLDVRA